jgi:hypothetical protein
MLVAPCALATVEHTTTFTYIGGEQRLRVPPHVTSVNVTAVGSAGGSTFPTSGLGGVGAVVSGSVPVTPTHFIYVEVGGASFNGGGPSDFLHALGGGGASDVRTVSIGNEPSPGGEPSLLSRLLVAAGGGGGGETALEHCLGGAGGAGEEAGAPGQTCENAPTGGGGAGTANAGGAAGVGLPYVGRPAGPGSLGQGGHAAGGGGGGGGLFGGGGGGTTYTEFCDNQTCGWGADAGGGGGSNLVPQGGEARLDPREGEPGFLAPSVTISYPVSCTAATGIGSFLPEGTAGHLQLADRLTTNPGEEQYLRVRDVEGSGHVVDYKLEKLEEALCGGAAGEREFIGFGTAVHAGHKGYTLTFSIREENGGFYFKSEISKSGRVLEAVGGPLNTKTQQIG